MVFLKVFFLTFLIASCIVEATIDLDNVTLATIVDIITSNEPTLKPSDILSVATLVASSDTDSAPYSVVSEVSEESIWPDSQNSSIDRALLSSTDDVDENNWSDSQNSSLPIDRALLRLTDDADEDKASVEDINKIESFKKEVENSLGTDFQSGTLDGIDFMETVNSQTSVGFNKFNDFFLFEDVKAQIVSDFKPFLMLIPGPVKKFIGEGLKRLFQSISATLRGALKPMMSVAAKLLIVVAKGVHATGQSLIKVADAMMSTATISSKHLPEEANIAYKQSLSYISDFPEKFEEIPGTSGSLAPDDTEIESIENYHEVSFTSSILNDDEDAISVGAEPDVHTAATIANPDLQQDDTADGSAESHEPQNDEGQEWSINVEDDRTRAHKRLHDEHEALQHTSIHTRFSMVEHVGEEVIEI